MCQACDRALATRGLHRRPTSPGFAQSDLHITTAAHLCLWFYWYAAARVAWGLEGVAGALLGSAALSRHNTFGVVEVCGAIDEVCARNQFAARHHDDCTRAEAACGAARWNGAMEVARALALFYGGAVADAHVVWRTGLGALVEAEVWGELNRDLGPGASLSEWAEAADEAAPRAVEAMLTDWTLAGVAAAGEVWPSEVARELKGEDRRRGRVVLGAFLPPEAYAPDRADASPAIDLEVCNCGGPLGYHAKGGVNCVAGETGSTSEGALLDARRTDVLRRTLRFCGGAPRTYEEVVGMLTGAPSPRSLDTGELPEDVRHAVVDLRALVAAGALQEIASPFDDDPSASEVDVYWLAMVAPPAGPNALPLAGGRLVNEPRG